MCIDIIFYVTLQSKLKSTQRLLTDGDQVAP